MSLFCGVEFPNVCVRARSRPWGKELLAYERHVYPRRGWERGRQRHLWWQPYRAPGLLRGWKKGGKKSSIDSNTDVRAIDEGPTASVSVILSLQVTPRCHHSHLMNCESSQLCISITTISLIHHKHFILRAFKSLRVFFFFFLIYTKLRTGLVVHVITSSSVCVFRNSPFARGVLWFFCVSIPGVQPANPSYHKRRNGAKRSMINEPRSPLPRMHLQLRHYCGAAETLQRRVAARRVSSFQTKSGFILCKFTGIVWFSPQPIN